MGKLNYYKWAFRFTIWILIIQIVLFFLGFNFNLYSHDIEQFIRIINYLVMISLLLFVTAVIFLIVGFVKREEQNYQFWIAFLLCIGYVINLVLGQLATTTYVIF
ncbi:hypothetical protein [uncultured Kordia sp.]|uniref:hypothetical protein n=1 Tax=uncultured Kordia sp. TaxID=507699 RepID=UPI00262AA7F6|nr:hypothetical protein [uncultured Kordia sp.]